MKKLNSIFGAIFIALILTNCNTNTQNENTSNDKSLVGKWIVESTNGMPVDTKSYMLLNEDYTAMEVNSFGENERTWFVKGNDLCLKALEADGGIESCGSFKIKGNKLIWTIFDMEMVYKKE